jgi:hypothetical protein
MLGRVRVRVAWAGIISGSDKDKESHDVVILGHENDPETSSHRLSTLPYSAHKVAINYNVRYILDFSVSRRATPSKLYGINSRYSKAGRNESYELRASGNWPSSSSP